MRHWKWLPGVCVALVLSGGCEPVKRYNAGVPRTGRGAGETLGTPSSGQPPKAAQPKPLNPNISWMAPTPSLMDPPVRLEFVTAADNPKEWADLKQFWTVAAANPSLIGLPPLPAATTAAAQQAAQVVKIKVPLGLEDPSPHIPPSNPPTLGKWALGKKLFFDDGWLNAGPLNRESCASCHEPGLGFTSNRMMPFGSVDTPTLANGVYHTALFWDGRATALEEVVQRSLEDERPPSGASPARHTWSGVVERLQKQPAYVDLFVKNFGTQPTQDAIGKALATYLRTILCGNSVHDRALEAMRARKANMLEPADYEKALADVDVATLKAWERDEAKKPDVAKELHAGWALFTGKALCIKCHSGAIFTNDSFHNLGVADSSMFQEPGKETGRFAVLPIGLKDARMIGAYRTPTLRGLDTKRRRYFHDGYMSSLFEVVAYHVKVHGGAMNPYLDPELRDPMDPNKPRDLGLKEEDVRALVLFLHALQGEAIAAVVREPEKPPEPPK